MQTQNKKILVVDDEASIRKALEGIFCDEGFQVEHAESGEKALSIIKDNKPAAVFLDIWMPGLDGIETLKNIKQIYPDLPVIMISGHATIATAITATKLGASDFIEKPLDLETVIERVKSALSSDNLVQDKKIEFELLDDKNEDTAFDMHKKTIINPIAFLNTKMKVRRFKQKTLAHSAVLYGQGLHSGKKSGLILEPLPPFSGIHFVGMSNESAVPAHVDYVGSTGFATTVKLGTTQAGTIEHIMSALHAYGISNLLIKCNGEVPVMDGSAREFCSLFDEIGLEEQDQDWYEIAIEKTLRIGNDREFIQIEPADEFIIDYKLDYPEPLGKQHFTFTLSDIESYKNQIAPCRTLGFVKDIGALQKQGLALGGRFDNFILFGSDGPINDKLRFADEPVRHKILDAIGDLFLLGRKLRGKVTASMTGHSDNIELLKLIRNNL